MGVILAMAAMVALAVVPVARGAQITGFADENVPNWSQTAMDVSAGSGTSQVRHIVAWDVALDPAGVTALSQWISGAQAQGKEVMISFGGHKGATPPTPATDYRYAIDRFRRAFPDVTLFTAWNEPNHPLGGTNPTGTQAGQYWNQLDAACQAPSSTGKTCTVAAGDFSDYNSLTTYVDDYRAALHTYHLPDVWAVHAYNAINSTGLAALTSWVANKTNGKPVWITEVGAFYCTGGDPIPPNAADLQVARANNLRSLMASSSFSRLARVYYYFLAVGGGGGARCPSLYGVEEDDPGLIGAGNSIRPALTTLFPELQAPSVQTGGPSSITATAATLSGTIDPHRLRTTYRFEYGTTTAYNQVAPIPDGNAGASPQSVSTAIGGLQPVTTYHYRLVATNALGTVAGADAVFTTTAVDDQPAAVAGFAGAGASTFARADDGTIRVSTWTGSSQSPWTSLGGTAVSGPAAARRADGTVDVFALWADGAYRHKTISPNGIESAWESIGGSFVSAPAAVVRRAGHRYLDVVGRGTDGSIYLRTLDPATGSWGSWGSLGGSFRSAPAVVSWFNGGLDVVARGTDDQIWRKSWNGTAWTGWESLGGSAASGPAATSYYSGNLEVFYRGSDGSVYRKSWNGTVWSGWSLFSAALDSAPAAISELSGQLALYGRSGSQIVQRKWENNAWWPLWYGLGNPSLRVGQP